jgi:hypothetical protein
MSTTHTIGKYKLTYYGKRDSESKSIAQITFYSDQNQFLGSINFYKDGQSIPDNGERTSSSTTQVFLRASEKQLPGVVDMLRNEKPCSLYFYSATYGSVFTGKEPVGEEETE